ncbi:uncharacterized protein BdWA1_004113 [Babesia duncani]|uniref:Uncharacterized protein n=1 Tax=Babesia duncani TaxID=323732 RepID=A0AAD9PGJ4_9APIC|nr:hypothetical protein BdWA1_004113 [Babesia duncani]
MRTTKISKSAQAPKALEGSEGKPTTVMVNTIKATRAAKNSKPAQNIKPYRISKPDKMAKMVGMITAAKNSKSLIFFLSWQQNGNTENNKYRNTGKKTGKPQQPRDQPGTAKLSKSVKLPGQPRLQQKQPWEQKKNRRENPKPQQ